MKLWSVVFGLLLSNAAFAGGTVDTEAVPASLAAGTTLHGSCNFEGEYASGCIEFYDGTWNDESMQSYCQEKSKAGATVAVSHDPCGKNDYNSLCANMKDDGSLANIYVNSMPAFICKKYLNGTLTKRPAGGW